jgi:hypothetical protein
MCICCISLCVFVVSHVYLLYFLCVILILCTAVLTLDAGLLARSQYPEGPATDHLDRIFLVFPVSTSEC